MQSELEPPLQLVKFGVSSIDLIEKSAVSHAKTYVLYAAPELAQGTSGSSKKQFVNVEILTFTSALSTSKFDNRM